MEKWVQVSIAKTEYAFGGHSVISIKICTTPKLNKVKVSLLHQEKSKKYLFWMLRNLTIGRYLCFHKHRRRNLKAYLNIYSRESIFLLKGNLAIQFNHWNDDSEKFVNG